MQEKSAIWLKFRYQRDPIGNRLTSTTAESGSPVSSSYTSNPLNQYTAISSSLPSVKNPSYDDDGNTVLCPLSSGVWSFTWDAENRMISAESASTRLEFSYDYMGRRVEKKVYSGSPGSWSLDKHLRFVYDEYLQIEELNALDSNSVAKKRIWSNGQIIAETQGANTYYALSDANKNITEYLDASGTIEGHYEFSPFGKITVATGSNPDAFDFRFSSEYFDSETGLVYYNFRYYSSELGRWLSREKLGEGVSWNLYMHTRNSPMLFWDYLGLDPKWYERHGAVDKFLTGLTSIDKVVDGITETARESDPTIPAVPKDRKYEANLADRLQSLRKPFKRRDLGYSPELNHCISSCEVSEAFGNNIAMLLGEVKELRDLGTGGLELIVEGIASPSVAQSINERLQGGSFDESVEDYICNYDGLRCANASEGCECCCKKIYGCK